MTGRRNFLKLIGGGIVVAAGAGGLWASTRDPSAARLAWQTAGQGETDPRRKALSYAVLAPNPHNRQPWLADLSTPDEILLTCEGERRLPATDPFDRQITIGLGAFIELLTMAAAEDGYRAEVTLFPEGEPQPRLDGRPVARIRMIADPAAARDPLFAEILNRHTNRGAYDTARLVDAAVFTQLESVVRTSELRGETAMPRVTALRSLAWDAMMTEMTTPVTALESINLTRIGKARIEANPDGISLAGPLIEALDMAGMLKAEDMLDPSSSTFRQMSASLKVPFDTVMGFVWLTTPGNSRADQIAAGRDYVRVHLAATRLGLAMQPFSQALQEFPQMNAHFGKMRESLKIAPERTLQMFARLGYGPAAPASPRWPYPSRIRNA